MRRMKGRPGHRPYRNSINQSRSHTHNMSHTTHTLHRDKNAGILHELFHTLPITSSLFVHKRQLNLLAITSHSFASYQSINHQHDQSQSNHQHLCRRTSAAATARDVARPSRPASHGLRHVPRIRWLPKRRPLPLQSSVRVHINRPRQREDFHCQHCSPGRPPVVCSSAARHEHQQCTYLRGQETVIHHIAQLRRSARIGAGICGYGRHVRAYSH